jgi:hypothetical protein
MSETLYPHEQIIKILKEPQSELECLIWYIYGLSSMLIVYFVSIEANNIIAPLKFQDFIIFGLYFDCVLCVILMVFGCIGIIAPNKRS